MSCRSSKENNLTSLQECEMLTHNSTPLVIKAEIKFSIPGINTKSNDSEATLKTLTLSELDKSYPATAWTRFIALMGL